MGVDNRTFLGLVDEVLVAAGRRKLESANRAIVEVKDADRVLQILAGPGSGKTEMLVWRVLHELVVRGTPSTRVMVTTFTRKAATELSVRLVERADALLAAGANKGVKIRDPRVHDLRVGTIHSLCDRMLAEFDDAYMASGTQLIDEVELMVRLVRAHRFAIGYDNAKKRVLNRLLDVEELVSLFRAPWDEDGRWPSNTVQRMKFVSAVLGQHTETWIPRCERSGTKNGIEAVHGVANLTDDLVKMRTRWSEHLTKNHITDFTTLQHRFLQAQHKVLGQLDHVLVDEFQDTNPIQFAIHAKWLDAPRLRLTVVGDDDQAMYRFRGSDFKCFTELEPYCQQRGVLYRREKLEKNWRSTGAIVAFSQRFKDESVLAKVSMPKAVVAGDGAAAGVPVRLLRGPWAALCTAVAKEIAGRTPPAIPADPSTACLMFSTSEKGSARRGDSAAKRLRDAIEGASLRVYNARNKTAGGPGSPVAELLGLISYLVDPIDRAPAGKKDRLIEVWASMGKDPQASFARTLPPPFYIAGDHASFQKRFVKENGKIGAPAADRRELFEYIDTIRDKLAAANNRTKKPRLTLAGLVARLLAFPRYRDSGYTVSLFRQALFTELLEANIAPSRMTMNPLDAPLPVEKVGGKFKWPPTYWQMLGTFGALVEESDLDDPDVDAFEQNAVMLMTFHQSKGLEFDHVYVAGTGRSVAPHSVLQTLLFSGEMPAYKVVNAQPVTTDAGVLQLAEADRERELYVAMTRAKKTLTFLWDPDDGHPLMGLNPVLEKLVAKAMVRPLATGSSVDILEWAHA